MAAALGIYAGAVTNTPALGAPWQTLSTLVLDCAHTEARQRARRHRAVKLMGRHAGFIRADAVVASQDVNFALVPRSAFRSSLPRRVEAADA